MGGSPGCGGGRRCRSDPRPGGNAQGHQPDEHSQKGPADDPIKSAERGHGPNLVASGAHRRVSPSDTGPLAEHPQDQGGAAVADAQDDLSRPTTPGTDDPGSGGPDRATNEVGDHVSGIEA